MTEPVNPLPANNGEGYPQQPQQPYYPQQGYYQPQQQYQYQYNPNQYQQQPQQGLTWNAGLITATIAGGLLVMLGLLQLIMYWVAASRIPYASVGAYWNSGVLRILVLQIALPILVIVWLLSAARRQQAAKQQDADDTDEVEPKVVGTFTSTQLAQASAAGILLYVLIQVFGFNAFFSLGSGLLTFFTLLAALALFLAAWFPNVFAKSSAPAPVQNQPVAYGAGYTQPAQATGAPAAGGYGAPSPAETQDSVQQQPSPATEPAEPAEAEPEQEQESQQATETQPVSQQPFWFAVHWPRFTQTENGEQAFQLQPGNWILALEDRGTEFLVQSADGQQTALLRNLEGIERAPQQ